jgi:hypothetical protein
MRLRIGTAQQDMAAAERTPGAHHDREAVALGKEIGKAKPHPAAGDECRNHHDDRVGDRKRGIAAHVAASRDIALGKGAAACQRIAKPDPDRRSRVQVFIRVTGCEQA